MPVVPRVSEPSVQDQPFPTVRLQPSAPIEAFGGGQAAAQTFGAIRQFSQGLSDIAIDAKRRADDVMTQDAYVELLKRKNDRLYNPDQGVYSQKGRSALALPDTVGKQFGKDIDEIGGKLNNDSQRAMFSRMAAKEGLEFDAAMQHHVLNETKIVEKESLNSLISTLQEDAALNPANTIGNLETMDKALQSHYAKQGIVDPKDPIFKSATERIRSKTHAAVLTKMLVDGQGEQATEYEQSVKGQILQDDLDVLYRVRHQEERRAEQEADEAQRKLFMRAQDGRLPLEEIDSLFNLGQIDTKFYKELKNRILAVNDRPEIPEDQKAGKFLELLNDFDKLSGGKLDKTGKLLKPASSNDLKTLQKFRTKVSANAGYLTSAQERAFFDFTQKNFDEAHHPKIGIFAGLKAILGSMAMSAADRADALTSAMYRIFDPKTTIDQAHTEAQNIGTAAAIATNPNRSLYTVGQIINTSGGSVKVVGHDKDGEPLVERIK